MRSSSRRVRGLAVCIIAIGAMLFATTARSRAGAIDTESIDAEPFYAGQQESMPGPDARQLWEYISTRYKSWNNFPNMPSRFVRVSENPHGDWIAVYANDPAYQSIAYPSKPFQMKYGSIIVKENYSLTNGNPVGGSQLLSVPVALTSLTVMYKVRGYQRVAGEEEWFWVMYNCPGGQCKGQVATISNQPFVSEQIPQSKDTFSFFQGEVVTGKPWICIECHQRANLENAYSAGDYVWKLLPFAPK